MQPKVSVIIPVYNTERFLQDCIDSLVSQTLKEIELIFVNDVSPDHCLNILQENQKMHPAKIRIINSKVNLKQGGARNLGIHEAKADYVAFVDSDDFVAPTMLERLYERIIEKEADVSITKYADVSEGAQYQTLFSPDFKECMTKIHGWDEEAQIFDGRVLSEKGIKKALALHTSGAWGALWKKEIIEKNNVYFPEHLRYEDNFWVWLIKCYTKKYTFVDEIGYYYRNVQNSAVHANNQLYHWDRITILELLLEEAKKRGIYSKYYEIWESIGIFTCFSTYFLFMHKFDRTPVDLVKKIPKECLEQFPNWKRNSIYKRTYPKLRRAKYAVIEKCPVMMLYVHPIWEKVQKDFKSIKRKEGKK